MVSGGLASVLLLVLRGVRYIGRIGSSKDRRRTRDWAASRVKLHTDSEYEGGISPTIGLVQMTLLFGVRG